MYITNICLRLGISNNITSLKKEAENILILKAELLNVIYNLEIYIYMN